MFNYKTYHTIIFLMERMYVIDNKPLNTKKATENDWKIYIPNEFSRLFSVVSLTHHFT